ncbi:MAG: cytochrome c peroxidase [Candidatus Paceibacteria bacterium]|jgi:cytochrome c peroxidase
MHLRLMAGWVLVGLCVLGAAQSLSTGEQAPVVFEGRELARVLALSPLPEPELDRTNRFDGQAAAERLGHRLFFDKGLSASAEVSCASCHDPSKEFSDAQPVPETPALFPQGTRRTPSLWNVAQGHWFFHDGRADSLWAQALGPLESAFEMASDRLAILHYIAGEDSLRAEFEALAGPLPKLEQSERFPAHARPDRRAPQAPHALRWGAMAEADREAVNRSFSAVGKLLAAYERRLVKNNSPFDRFVAGLRAGQQVASDHYPQAAQRGLRLFLGKGNCRLCHNGPNFSDGEFHGLGLGARGGGMPTDPGRYSGLPDLLASEFRASGVFSDDPSGERARNARGLVRSPANWGEFKTASLRNVAGRGPYMHAGQFDTLREVLHFYSTLEGAAPLHQHQEQILTARDFTDAELVDLESFLVSLSGEASPGPWLAVPVAVPD